MPAWEEPLRQDCDGSHRQVDRLLIRTAAGQAGIGNDDGHIAGSAPEPVRASPIKGHAVVTDTNPRRSPRPAAPDSQSDTTQSRTVQGYDKEVTRSRTALETCETDQRVRSASRRRPRVSTSPPSSPVSRWRRCVRRSPSSGGPGRRVGEGRAMTPAEPNWAALEHLASMAARLPVHRCGPRALAVAASAAEPAQAVVDVRRCRPASGGPGSTSADDSASADAAQLTAVPGPAGTAPTELCGRGADGWRCRVVAELEGCRFGPAHVVDRARSGGASADAAQPLLRVADLVDRREHRRRGPAHVDRPRPADRLDGGDEPLPGGVLVELAPPSPSGA